MPDIFVSLRKLIILSLTTFNYQPALGALIPAEGALNIIGLALNKTGR